MRPLLVPALLLLLCCAPVQAEEPADFFRDLTPTDFTRLATRPIGMGGAWVATGGDEQVLFHNPALLAKQKFPRFGTSHSARHFPGPVERDHLDADPTALIWPVSPFLTIGNGWVTFGELGYAHHDLSDPDFPRQHLWGIERADGLAWDFLLLQVGASRRAQQYRYADAAASAAAPEQPAQNNPSLQVLGEGTMIGLAGNLPGVVIGWAQERLKQDYYPADQPVYGVTRTTDFHAWALRPTAWLTFTGQTDYPSYRIIQDGTKRTERAAPVRRSGGECWLGPWAAVRWGAVDGAPTWGVTLKLPLLPSLHWGEMTDAMPRIVQGAWPDKYANTHHYSWSLGV